MIGSENARPVSTANGTVASSPHDRVSGTNASTAATPAARQRGPGGVPERDAGGDVARLRAAWRPSPGNRKLHVKPSITGHIASWAITIITVVAIRAGARKAR